MEPPRPALTLSNQNNLNPLDEPKRLQSKVVWEGEARDIKIKIYVTENEIRILSKVKLGGKFVDVKTNLGSSSDRHRVVKQCLERAFTSTVTLSKSENGELELLITNPLSESSLPHPPARETPRSRADSVSRSHWDFLACCNAPQLAQYYRANGHKRNGSWGGERDIERFVQLLKKELKLVEVTDRKVPPLCGIWKELLAFLPLFKEKDYAEIILVLHNLATESQFDIDAHYVSCLRQLYSGLSVKDSIQTSLTRFKGFVAKKLLETKDLAKQALLLEVLFLVFTHQTQTSQDELLQEIIRKKEEANITQGFRNFFWFNCLQKKVTGSTHFDIVKNTEIITIIENVNRFLDELMISQDSIQAILGHPVKKIAVEQLLIALKDLGSTPNPEKHTLDYFVSYPAIITELKEAIVLALHEYALAVSMDDAHKDFAKNLAKQIEEAGGNLTRLRHIERSAFPTHLFTKAFFQIDPLLQGAVLAKETLMKDRILIENQQRYIPLTVQLPQESQESEKALQFCEGKSKTHPSSSTRPGEVDFEAFFDYFRTVSQASTLSISGDLGAGKSFGTCMIVKGLWDVKDEKRVLALYISLPTCSNPRDALNETLTTLKLNTHMEELRKATVYVFLDAIEEVYPSTKGDFDPVRELPELISKARGVLPSAKFIVTFRDAFSAQLSFQKDSDLSCTLLPMSDDALRAYIQKHIEICELEGRPCPWTLEEFEYFLNEYPHYKEKVRIPLFAGIMVRTLPKIREWIDKQKGRANKDFYPEHEILDADFCLTVEREIHELKERTADKKVPFDLDKHKEWYIEYSIEVAKTFHSLVEDKTKFDLEALAAPRSRIPLKVTCPVFTWEKLNQARPDLFDGKSEKEQEKDKEKAINYWKRRCSPMVKMGNDKWGIRHDIFYRWLLTLVNPERKNEIISRLKNDDFKFASFLAEYQQV